MKIKGQKVSHSVLISRLLLFLVIWWVLSGGVASSWIIGVPAVICALLASLAWLPSVRFVWWRLIVFIPFFLWQSLKGGIEVAWLTFQPRLPLSPKLIEYPLELPEGLAQVAMVNITSLLPGTLSSNLDKGVLKVHVLDSQSDYLAGLQGLEQHLKRIFPNVIIDDVQEVQ